jgi:mannose/fructose-specific phosphotransferase system component IIA
MTPKEKAFELAHKFRLLEIRTSENSHMMISMADAKQCALIAVDEVLNTIMSVYQPETKAFWQEVKQEIEKL